ncbi:MAG: 30S ribosomal protein S12 methylthiotransferase RimO [Treponema sp.]|nr:30S ribosomal protein S12 methylthiotransferase RimO [Treponema sp.]
MSDNKKFFLDQHGCAKNQVDGELIMNRLVNLGFTQTFDASEADVIFINSCGFIESAKTESIESLMNARNLYPDAKIILGGCLAERYAEYFKDELTEADAIFGNGDLSKIDGLVKSLFDGERPVVKPAQEGVCCGERKKLLSYPGSAFVKITEGCDNCCSFCAIPIIRGHLRSRKIEEIVEEIKQLVDQGIFEINLIGQDLAAFGSDFVNHKNSQSELANLLEEISKLKGDFWIRLLYIHPDHFNSDILEIMKKDERFLPYFDIPFQSGSDRIISLMNRKGNFKKYVELIKTIRSAFSESCIRTTFLNGFPSETDDDAATTQKFMKEIKPDWSGCFAYSQEEDTVAAKMENQVEKKVAEKRSSALKKIQDKITAESLEKRCEKNYRVLIEEIVENLEGTDEGLAIGRTWFEAPDVDGNVVVRYDLDDKNAVEKIIPGKVVTVKAVAASGVDIDSVFVE